MFVSAFLFFFRSDLFAFVIKMPILHRLACFRDDIIFFIYLYQWWIYPVDHKRSNEYGQGGDDSETVALPENEAMIDIDSSVKTLGVDSDSGNTNKVEQDRHLKID